MFGGNRKAALKSDGFSNLEKATPAFRNCFPVAQQSPQVL